MKELERLKRVLREIVEVRAGLERLRKSSPPPESDILRGTTTVSKEDQALVENARATIAALTKLNVALRKSLNRQIGPRI